MPRKPVRRPLDLLFIGFLVYISSPHKPEKSVALRMNNSWEIAVNPLPRWLTE